MSVLASAACSAPVTWPAAIEHIVTVVVVGAVIAIGLCVLQRLC